MPVNDRYPLADVLAECRRYVELRGRRVFVEYVMLGGVNDTPEHAEELARSSSATVFKVNMIPYNPTGEYEGSSREAIDAFKSVLGRGGSRRPSGSPGAARSPRPAGSSRPKIALQPSRKRSSLASGRHPRRSSYMRRRPVQILAFLLLATAVLAAAGCGSKKSASSATTTTSTEMTSTTETTTTDTRNGYNGHDDDVRDGHECRRSSRRSGVLRQLQVLRRPRGRVLVGTHRSGR